MARLAFLLAGTALATTCAIALLRPAPDAAGLSDQEKLRDLLDPSRAAALACKGPRKTGLAAFLAVASANAAEARAGSATPRERALISALGERYSSAADADRAAFDAAYAVAMWHYARGVAHAAAGHVELAEAEAGAIDGLRTGGDFSLLTAGGVPAPQVLELAALVVRGRIAQAEGNRDAAVDAFRRAAAIQDGLPYTEPPYWYYPARQSLGAALLAAGDAGAAVTAFRKSLFDAPNNGFALYGLIAAERMRGDEAAAAAARAAFEAAWTGEREPDLARL